MGKNEGDSKVKLYTTMPQNVDFVSKEVDFVSKEVDFVSKEVDFVSK